MVDWENPESKVSQYFTVRECLWLPHWSRLAEDDDGLNDEIKNSLYALCQVMDHVRGFLGTPINVHCMYRPPKYSVLVGGFENDVHTMGMAIDFDISNMECDDVRELLEPQLEFFGIRMEKNPGANWIHLDIHPVIRNRYFAP